MALVRTFKLPHYESYPVHVALFKDVKNAGYLRSQLLEANPDFDYAFLDAEMVGSKFHSIQMFKPFFSISI
jgi:EKC/KEOPS complex subunit CGI121/TPRKB